jgi:starvation-inducible DNA-binding protein
MKTKPNIGINDEHLSEITHALNIILADEYVLYTKTLNAHWNVEGPDFHSKHVFFESQYEQLAEMIDSVAERIRLLGHYAPATLKSFLELTHFSERLHDGNSGSGFIEELLADHESLITHFRGYINYLANDLKDMGTSDFITGLMEDQEKMAWMLRAHLK